MKLALCGLISLFSLCSLVTAVTPTPTPSATPAGQISLAWDYPAGINDILRFDIWLVQGTSRTLVAFTTRDQNGNPPLTTVTVFGLTPGQTYTFTATATGLNGKTSPESNQATGTVPTPTPSPSPTPTPTATPTPTPPPAPSNLRITAIK